MGLRKWRDAARRIYWTWRVRRQAASCGEAFRANNFSYVTDRTHIGSHVNFNGMRVKGSGDVRIGNYFHSGEECLIISSFHNFDGGSALPYGRKTEDIARTVEIGDLVWLGDRVTILGGASIGEGAIIQAGSVVVDDIPACAIAGGHPAKVFKMRNLEHFQYLKLQKKFK